MSIKVKFISNIEIEEPDTLLKVAKSARVKIKDSCDGKGKCGKCIVKILEGTLSKPTKQEKKLLGEENLSKGYRLACEVEATEDTIIELVHK
ncbi:ferredoxin [Anaerosolibacter carboniphilus]|uniref:Ferredoxin n=1 Tax=Anaerosolibacter carboniphilus TaxID=1417629 RepID=A0A841L064_9FIRM|nr:2Fe-2S iron-sulfur cluster binding domain-containing protein [Anaerosolibacter carboniphilus]MBB6218943.1 ferredoxin [Anaerosolibacter carboniphilus]